MEQSDKFVSILTKQIDERRLDHAALRQVLFLQRACIWKPVTRNWSLFLAAKGISYNDFKLSWIYSASRHQWTYACSRIAHGLLALDTIFFTVKQDTARMKLQGGVINGPANPQFVFRSTLTGEVRNEDAELTVDYVNGKGQTGVLFGINARPLTEGHGRGNGGC